MSVPLENRSAALALCESARAELSFVLHHRLVDLDVAHVRVARDQLTRALALLGQFDFDQFDDLTEGAP